MSVKRSIGPDVTVMSLSTQIADWRDAENNAIESICFIAYPATLRMSNNAVAPETIQGRCR